MRPGVGWAVVTATAGVVHALGAHVVAGTDVVLAVLIGGRLEIGLVVLALLVARLFLFLLAPGWALYVLVTMGMARHAERRSRPRG